MLKPCLTDDSKEVIMSFASIMLNRLSHEEIMALCISMLYAEVKCGKEVRNE